MKSHRKGKRVGKTKLIIIVVIIIFRLKTHTEWKYMTTEAQKVGEM